MRRGDQRGSALPLVLSVIALLMPLGALAVLQARNDLLIEQSLRGATEAFYAADGALEWAIAALPPTADADRLLDGPDGISGTADDGLYPYPIGYQPVAPARFELRLQRGPGKALQLQSIGSGFAGAVAVLEATLVPSADPYAPAAAYAASPVVPSFGSSSFRISGFDHTSDDSFGSASGAAPPLPALALPSAAAAAQVGAQLDAAEATHLPGAGGTPSLGHAAIELTPLAARIAAAPPATHYAAPDLPVDLSAGTSEAPQVTVIDSDAALAGSWSGAGLLLVRGRLQVDGRLEFRGLVIAVEGVRIEAGASTLILGGLWAGQPPLELWGDGGIAACAVCLRTADQAFPGLLPHRLEPRGWVQRFE